MRASMSGVEIPRNGARRESAAAAGKRGKNESAPLRQARGPVCNNLAL